MCRCYITELFIDVSLKKMHGAPRIRKDLIVSQGLVAKDQSIARNLARTLGEAAVKCRRDKPLAELDRAAWEVKLTYEVPERAIDLVPLRPRLERRFEAASVSSLHDELMCHLPLGVLAIKAAFAPSSFSEGFSLAKFGSLKLLLVALLPPVSSLGSLSLSALKAKKKGPPAANRGRRGDGGEHNSSPSGLELPRRRSF